MVYSTEDTATVCMSYCLSVCFSRGVTASLLVTANGTLRCLSVKEGILPLSGSRGDTASLWVTAEGILPLSGSRGDTATLWVTAQGILPLCRLRQRGYFHYLSEREYCHSVGYSRGDTATACLSENTHHIHYLYKLGVWVASVIFTPP